MNPISNNNPATAPAQSSAISGSLSQADFLKLMTAQLQAQDPTKPVDNTQFVSQMAQFSQLSSTQDMVASMKNLGSTLSSALQTSQVLGASSLVNRNVLVPSSTLNYSGGDAVGAVNISGAGTATVNIVDSSGKVVRSLHPSSQHGGLTQFSWDGNDDEGNKLAQGEYGLVAGSNGSTLDTYAAGKVTAVGYGGDNLGTYLQVAGVGGVPLTQIAQILQ
ncbi:MAG: flagellar hook capping FlgD N-terminal domain-containing protein [Rhodanobacter sp.]